MKDAPDLTHFNKKTTSNAATALELEKDYAAVV